jgi:serine/threonine-protein kinase
VFIASFYVAMQRRQRASEVEVPALVGMSRDEARERARGASLVLDVADERNDPRVASGHVLEQMPPAGSSVRRGRKVKVVLSLGDRVLAVPDLVGRPARALDIELRAAGFAGGDESRAYSYTAPAGIVLAQVPPAGTPALPSTRIHRLVSEGPPPVRWVMPDLTGRPRAQAEQWIELNGFRRGAVREVRAAGRAAGTVVGHQPLPGHPVRTRDIVELTIAAEGRRER